MRKRIWIIGLTAGMLLLAVMMVNFAGCAKTENALLSEFSDMTQEAPTPRGLRRRVLLLTSISAMCPKRAPAGWCWLTRIFFCAMWKPGEKPL